MYAKSLLRSALIAGSALCLTSSFAAAAELRMSWWGGDSRHVQTQEALKVCGAKYGHTIKAEFTGFQGHLEKLTTQLAGGTEADIMQVNWPWLPLFSKKGDGFADLNQYAKVLDLGQFGPDALASATINGKLNGIPISTTGRVFLFNKATFDKAGLPLPKTWDELIAAAKVFKEKLGPDYYPFEAITLNALLIVQLAVMQQTGKDLVDPNTQKVAWTAKELQAGIEFYQNLVKVGAIRPWKTAAGAGNVELFDTRPWAEGKIAGSYEWDSTYAKYADPLKGQPLVPVKPLLLKDAKNDGMYRKPSMVISISKRSKNPEAAAQVLNCLLNEPEAVKILGDSRGIPTSKIALETLKQAGAIGGPVAEANATVLAATGPTVSPYDEDPRLRENFQSTLEQVAYGELSAADAAADMIAEWNRILGKL
jgi:oligogalacturonide transport system substrate-binding protein